MKTPLLSALAVLSCMGMSSFAGAQDAPPPPDSSTMPPPVQEQANPQGAGAPTETVPAPESASEPVPPAMPADPNYKAGPYKGALTPPPAQELDKTYPPCTKKVQDNCRNRGGK